MRYLLIFLMVWPALTGVWCRFVFGMGNMLLYVTIHHDVGMANAYSYY